MTTEGDDARPGRPRNPAVHAALLTATQELLVEMGFERLTLEAVAARAGTAKTTIYRRWRDKTELVVAAVAASQQLPGVPDLGSLRDELLFCARAFQAGDDRTHRLLSGLLTEMGRNEAIRTVAQRTLGEPYVQLFVSVLRRAVDRGDLDATLDTRTIAEVFPAFALRRVVVDGRPVDEELAVRIVDTILMPLLSSSSRHSPR